jgi:hypothetical protein
VESLENRIATRPRRHANPDCDLEIRGEEATPRALLGIHNLNLVLGHVDGCRHRPDEETALARSEARERKFRDRDLAL